MPIRLPRLHAVTLALAAAVTPAGAPAAAQQTGPVIKAGAAEITLGGRVHTQFNTTTVDEQPASEFALRRVRLESTVKVNDWVSGKVQLDFAGNRVSVKDAFLRLAFDPAFQLVAGSAHRPFSHLVETSSNRILPVERGVRIRGLAEAWDEANLVTDLGYADRDVGVQVQGEPRGAPLGLRYAVGYFNGPARVGASERDTWQLAARAAVRPLPAVRLGAAWSRRHFVRAPDTGETGTLREAGNAYAVDLEVGGYEPGLHLLGEVAYGDFDPFAGQRFLGAQGWLAYRTPRLGEKVQHVEPVLRVSFGDPNANDRGFAPGGGTLLTPGLNLYLGGLNRVMFNWDYWNAYGGPDASSFKAQFQLAF